MDGFFGQTTREQAFGDFRLVEKRHLAEELLPEHEHDRPYATFVVRGQYVETVAGRSSDVRSGSVLLHAAGESHADRFGAGPAVLLNVEFPSADGPWRDVGRLVTAADAPIEVLAARLRCELHDPDDLSAMIVEGIMLEICGLLRRRSSAPAGSSLVRRADFVIAERFASRLALGAVAAAIGADASHLSRVFRREAGCTVGERIRQRRVDRACELLRTGRSLAEIALATGFADQSHFTRVFRSLTGLTPRAYRREIC